MQSNPTALYAKQPQTIMLPLPCAIGFFFSPPNAKMPRNFTFVTVIHKTSSQVLCVVWNIQVILWYLPLTTLLLSVFFIVDTESKIWASCRDFWQLLCSWCDLCRITGIFLLSYTFQFLLGIPESFPSHMRNIIALTCGSNPGGLLRCPNHLQRDGLMRILTRYIDYVKWVLLTRVERTTNYHHIIW